MATAAIAIIGLVWIGPDFLPKPVHTASARTLKIVTFNVFGGSNSHWTEIEAWLRQTNADIVVFQESPTQYREHGVTALKSLYPYQFAQPTIDGSMILSRFPFLSTENSVAGPDNGSVQTRVTLDFDGQIIAVYNIHLFIPLRGNPRLTLSRSQSPLITMALSYDDGFRNAQIKGVLDKLDKEQLPFIAAGDFNTSDQSVIYRTLADHMGDTFREVGIGLGGSWPVSRGEFPLFLPPLIRIDYIWHSKQFDAVDAQQGPKLGSDHLPLIGSLELRPAP